MECFVINLDRAIDRMTHIEATFAEIKLPYERVPAVDAQTMTSSELNAFRTSHPHPLHWRGNGQIAIFLSHMSVWRRIAEADNPAVAIFEDDIHIAQSARCLLELDAWPSADAMVVRLETTLQGVRVQQSPAGEFGPLRTHRLRSPAWGSAAYIVTKSAASLLASLPDRDHLPVDYMLFDKASSRFAREIQVLQVDPAPCVQDQYLPARELAHGFACETVSTRQSLTGMRSRVLLSLKPIARKLLRKKIVPFDSKNYAHYNILD